MPDPFPRTDEQLIEEAEDMLDSDPRELSLHMLQLRLMVAILKRLTKKDSVPEPKAEVYSDPDCIFHYCPTPDQCRAGGCLCPQTTTFGDPH